MDSSGENRAPGHRVMLHFRSIADMDKAIVANLNRIPLEIEVIVGIPRSGMLAASMLALHLNLPLTDLDGFLAGRLFQTGQTRSVRGGGRMDFNQTTRALIIDDSVCEGGEIARTRERIRGMDRDRNTVYAAVFATPDGQQHVDLAFEVVDMPRVFEWNVMHHCIIGHACLDLDGVLCPDPPEEWNDDGPMYKKFLTTAPRLLVPSSEIGWIVTSRLEKYRPETEQWLRNNGIAYRELRMLDLPSKSERVRLQAHVPFKASVYQETRSRLFVESSVLQARTIAREANKPVFCVENRQFYPPPMPGGGVFPLARRLIRLMKRYFR